MSTCLRVRFNEALKALMVHASLYKYHFEGTVLFIDKVIKPWKILNVPSKSKNILKNDPHIVE